MNFITLMKGWIALNKKHVKILSCILLSLLILYAGDGLIYKYPHKPPKLKVEYNGQSFKTGVSEFIWFEGKFGQTVGNSTICGSESDIAEEMDAIYVKTGDVLGLNLSYDKNISEMNVFEVIEDGESRKTASVESIDYKIKAPSDKGEHIYAVDIIWDSSIYSCHSIRFVIKLNVV